MNTEAKPKRTRSNYNRMMRAASRLRELYHMAQLCKMQPDELSAGKRKVLESLARATMYERGFIDGMDRVLWDAMYHQHLIWRLGTADVITPEGEKPADYSAVTHGAHFWRGSDVPFGEYKALDPSPAAVKP